MTIRRGDIVQVDLGGPADDDTRGEKISEERPGVVIRNAVGNAGSTTSIIAPVSEGYTGYPFYVNLP
jgi:mRNA-degrading endonuclease toxin of MazEF toxin-antitoxin module